MCSSCIVYLTPICGVSLRASDAGEAGEEPLSHGTNSIGGRHCFDELRVARCDVESEKVFHAHQIERGHTQAQILGADGVLVRGRKPVSLVLFPRLS